MQDCVASKRILARGLLLEMAWNPYPFLDHEVAKGIIDFLRDH